VIHPAEKGVDYAVDHCCHSPNFVAAGNGQWLHNWWIYSHPASYCHRRGADPNYSGTETIVAVWRDCVRSSFEARRNGRFEDFRSPHQARYPILLRMMTWLLSTELLFLIAIPVEQYLDEPVPAYDSGCS